MKTKKTLSLLLCLAMLISMIAGTGAMSLSATAETAKVPFRSPAILANVGDKIDLSKYGVEFAEGVLTTEGLTWWKEGVGTLTVPYDNPALFANVGDTVNFADYAVELTKGNTVSAHKLTWSQPLVQKVIPANNLFLQAEKGEKVDLKYFTVEGMGDNLTWKQDGKVVTEITAKAGDVLTVTDGSATKEVMVATKAGDEYAVYENDFSTDLNGIERAPFGGKEGQFDFSVADGVMKAVRADDYVSSVENMSIILPEYLWDLTNFSISFKSQFTDWAKKDTGASQKANGVYIGAFVHGDTTDVRPQHLVTFDPASHIYTMTRVNESKYAASETLKVKHEAIIPNLSKNQWEGYKVQVEGSKVTVYSDFDNDLKAPTGEYSKRLEYDFATVEGQTWTATTGAMGLAFFRSDSDVDDLMVTIPAIEYATKDATATFVGYTPEVKGLTTFTVTDGTNSRVVYLVTKNAEDTEYVLYENSFDTDDDFGGIERAGIGGDETKFGFSVANGVFSAVRADDYVSSVENTSLILPEYLWDFTNLSISFKAQFTDWAKKDTGTSQKATAYIGVFVHGDTTNYRPQHLVTFNPASNLKAMTRINEAKYAPSETLITAYDATIPNLSKNQWIGYKLDVEGSKVTAYTDFNSETTAPTGTFVKRVEHDFAIVEGQTLNATTGAIGLAFFRSDADVDDIKVTIPATEPTVELREITTFTPVEAGVTPITVKCGDVEKTIYVVAKNAADTEYVLYENEFEAQEDANDLTVIQGEADMTVADGYRYTFTAKPKAGYALHSLQVTDANGNVLLLSADNAGVYTVTSAVGGKVVATFAEGSTEVQEQFAFNANFAELAALAADSVYTDGKYKAPSTDTAVNNWANSKFGVFLNRESSVYHQFEYLCQPSDDFDDDSTYSGNMQWQLVQGQGLGLTVANKSGQLMRKSLTLTAKNTDGTFAELSDFEAEVVFNKGGKNNRVGGVYISFHEKYPGRASFSSSKTPTSKTGDVLVVGNALATYSNSQYGSEISVIAGAYDMTDNGCREGEVFTGVDWDVSADYKLYLKVEGETLTWSLTNLATNALVASGTDETPGGSGTVSVGVASCMHTLKSFKVKSLGGGSQPVNTALVAGNTVMVKTAEGYQLKAGSLVVTDANGDRFVPERVGFRENGDATQYTIPADAVAPYTVHAQFVQPATEHGYNIGFLGTSVHEGNKGLRFVHRVAIDKDGYMLYNDRRVKVAEYGVLMAASSVLADATALDLSAAENSKYILRFAWPKADKYYDNCDTYVDISVQVKGVGGTTSETLNLHSRVYVILEDGTTVYAAPATANYKDALPENDFEPEVDFGDILG